MPLLATVGSASVKSFGRSGIVTGGSAYYSSAGAAKLTMPAGTPFSYSTGNFTIEMWVYPTAFQTTNILWSQSSGRPSWFLWYVSSNGQTSFQFNGTVRSSSGSSLTLNQWNHVALVRSSNVIKHYINGVGSGAVTISTNMDNSITAGIGGYTHGESINGLAGYFTNVRVAKSAIYTSNFTPSMSPFTRTSQGATNVTFLLNCGSASAFLTDSSASAMTVSNPGSATYNAASPYKVPYVTPPSVVIMSATVTPNTTSFDEANGVLFTIAGTNTPNGTYYYTIEQAEGSGAITADDFDTGSLSGSFTITSGAGSISLHASYTQRLTEGDETFNIFVRSGSTTGTIIGTSPDILLTDLYLTPYLSTQAPHGEGGNIILGAYNIGYQNTTAYWRINHITTDDSDFSAVSGSFTLTGGGTPGNPNYGGSIYIYPTFDYVTEGDQTYTVSVLDSPGGTVLATSSTITLQDTSTTVTASASPTTIIEGGSTTITASATAMPATTYYWTILNGTTTNADFTATSGSFSVASNTGSFTVTAATLGGAEAAETFQVQIRKDSVSGTVLATTSAITISANAT